MKLFGKKRYNVLVLGSDGMLGHDVMEMLKTDALKSDSRINIVTGLDVVDGYDFSCPGALSRYLVGKIKYDYCVNCIAYTDTAKAETPDGRDMSYKLNALVPYYLALDCKFNEIKLIHISTDYVFSENSNDMTGLDKDVIPFETYSQPFPVNNYGIHKLLGEQFVQKVFGGANIYDYCIIRTSWLFGMHKEKSFVHKFLRNCMKTLAAVEMKSDEEQSMIDIEVTENEVSVPTSTSFLASVIRDVIQQNTCHPIVHGVPSGCCTRAEFAQCLLDSLVGGYKDCCANHTDKDSLCEIHDKLMRIEVKPVTRHGLWPEYSAMSNAGLQNVSFCRQPAYKDVIDMFVEYNFKSLMRFCENEYVKAGGKLKS